MEPFRRLAQFTVARDASFFALAGSTLMVGFSFQLPLALVIGANVALLFSLCLILRASLMSEERVTRTEAWRVLPRDQRPAGEGGRQWACGDLKWMWLRYAKAAAMVAIVLAGSSFVVGNPSDDAGSTMAKSKPPLRLSVAAR
jgi:hypothetical protein